MIEERTLQQQEVEWDELYRRAQPRLLAYARRRLPADAAADAVDETFARAVAAVGRYRDQGDGPDPWLFGILRNVVGDLQRKAARRGAVTVPSWTPDEPGPLDALLGREESAALRAAFSRLAPDDQDVLELRVVAGLDAEATAKVLGKRAGAVRMAQSRALARLRALLTEEEVER